MRALIQGAIFVLVLVLANVVAGGVIGLLGPLALELGHDLAQVLAVVLVGVLGVLSALAFIRGTLLFLVRPNPHKGLESPSGRRGG